MKLGLRDAIYGGPKDQDSSNRPTLIGNSNFSTRSKGYKNIFSNRSLAPGKPGGPPLDADPFSNLTSPKGNLMR